MCVCLGLGLKFVELSTCICFEFGTIFYLQTHRCGHLCDWIVYWPGNIILMSSTVFIWTYIDHPDILCYWLFQNQRQSRSLDAAVTPFLASLSLYFELNTLSPPSHLTCPNHLSLFWLKCSSKSCTPALDTIAVLSTLSLRTRRSI